MYESDDSYTRPVSIYQGGVGYTKAMTVLPG